MPRKRVRVAVTIDDVRRSLFSIVEKESGELILPLTHSPRYAHTSQYDWNNAPTILESRISIHPSPNSPEFTTIKKTIVLNNGKKITADALTDAVKAKNGFSTVFVRRSETLVGDGYAALGKMKPGDHLLSLPEFDPRRWTLFSGLFLGHPDIEFDAENDDLMLHIAGIKFKSFQLVAMFSLLPMRSHYTSDLASNMTFDPTKIPILRLMMSGKSASFCLEHYRNTVQEMTRRVLNIELREATNPAAIKDIRKRLRLLPKTKFIRIKSGRGMPPNYFVLGDLPPNRR
jgi:hypothetical protein